MITVTLGIAQQPTNKATPQTALAQHTCLHNKIILQEKLSKCSMRHQSQGHQCCCCCSHGQALRIISDALVSTSDALRLLVSRMTASSAARIGAALRLLSRLSRSCRSCTRMQQRWQHCDQETRIKHRQAATCRQVCLGGKVEKEVTQDSVCIQWTASASLCSFD